jgi:glycosyltransferase involved in cell wall biosynthesis
MRILLVDLGRDYRGGQQQAMLLLQGLAVRGHEPYLLAMRDSELARHAQEAGIPTHVASRTFRQFRSAATIREILSKHRPDVLHANEPHALTAAWIARTHRHIPIVASRRVIFPLSRGAISLARYRAAARIVAVSQCVAGALGGSELPADHVTVIPDGVPIPALPSDQARDDARKSFGIPVGVPLIGNVAAFTPDKGQANLICAFMEVRKHLPECQLLLAGMGPCRTDLEAMVVKSGLEGAVHFVGYLDDITRVYHSIDVFAFPAQAEALGTALLSAMAYGIPVIALARGGIPEVVENGRNGLLIEGAEIDTQIDSLSSAIIRLVSQIDEASRLGRAAREEIRARFSADRMVDTTIDLYRTLISGAKNAAGNSTIR